MKNVCNNYPGILKKVEGYRPINPELDDHPELYTMYVNERQACLLQEKLYDNAVDKLGHPSYVPCCQ
jgi:hypothetical protein